jgi:phosphate uptake regulator
MESRKITTLGKYSFVITLPIDWVRMHGLGRGDNVSVQIRGDGSLSVNPRLDLREKSSEAFLSIKSEEDVNSIIRSIIGCYLNGYRIIHLISDNNFTAEQQNAVRSVVRSLYMRILEATSSKVTLQTLMDESLASVISGIERMHIITSSMSQDVLKAMREWDDDLARSVITLEDDVNQFMYFLLRLLRSSVENPSLAVKLGLTMGDCFDYHLIINRIEYVADHLTNIATIVTKLKERSSEIPEQVFSSMIQSAETTFHYYDLAVDAFLSGKLDYTNEIIDNKEKLESQEEMLSPLQILGEAEKQIVIQLYGIIDDIARISKFASDIAELTIDRSFKR